MSPKNKGKFGKGKPAVEADDEFISTMSRVGKALEPHVKQIVIGVIAVALVLAALFGYGEWNAYKERKATTLYVKATMLANTVIIPTLPPPSEAEEDGDNPDATDKAAAPDKVEDVFNPFDNNHDGLPDSFPSKAERAKAVLPLLTKLKSKYGSTDSGKSARLLHATMLYDLGDYAAAEKMYKSYLSSEGPTHLKVLAREGMGAASEAQAMAIADQGQRNAALDGALALYRKIQTSEKKLGWERALYHQARVLAIQGKTEDAKKLLKQAVADMPESPMLDDIEGRLALLESAR